MTFLSSSALASTASTSSAVGDAVPLSCSTTNPIIPYISVAGVWSAAGETTVTVASGTAVNLGPQPLSGGTWSWSGPNGYASTSREIDNIPLSAGANVYTATYTVSGCSYMQAFTVTVTSAALTPYPITSGSLYTVVNAASNDCIDDTSGATGSGTPVEEQSCATGDHNQEWLFTNVGTNSWEITTDNLAGVAWNVIGPSTTPGTGIQLYPYYSGALNMQFKAFQLPSGNAEFIDENSGLCLDLPSKTVGEQLEINTCNQNSTSQSFKPTPVTGPTCSTTNPIIPYIAVAGVWGAAGETSVTVASGTAVDLGPQPLNSGTWSWSGPNGYASTSREIDNITLSAGANIYTATYTINGCSYTQTFTVTVTSGGGDFALASTPAALSVVQGSIAFDTITVTDVGGFTGLVNLAASGLPSGVTAAIAPSPATTSSVVTFTASSSAASGTSTVTITGTNSSASPTTTTIALTVTPANNCSNVNPIMPFVAVGGAWSNTGTSEVTVTSGTAVDLGPQPSASGSWSWTGPNGFTSTSREIDNIPLSAGDNLYTATYTNNGCSYKWPFYVAVVSSSAAHAVAIDMGVTGGAPTYGASGFIYGISQDVTTPVASYQRDINTRLMRADGSQIGCPNGGWINGGFTPRWDFIQLYYARAVSVGSNYDLLLAGLYGADGPCTVSTYPGDNGNWTGYNNYLSQVISSAKADGMAGAPDFQWEIWNEPNGGYFWARSEAQFLSMWQIGYSTIRTAIPNAIIVGPAAAGVPTPGDSWWSTYLNFIKANNQIPNYFAWHDESGDAVVDVSNFRGMLTTAGITTMPAIEINEYGGCCPGSGGDQEPGATAWYLGRFERAGVALAARGNWGGGTGAGGLYDTMADLLTPGADQAEGQWWVVQRYGEETGLKTELLPSGQFDGTVYQDSSAKKSIAVIGNNQDGGAAGNVSVTYLNIPSWLVSGGKTNVLVERLPQTDAFVSAPTTVSNSTVTVSGNSITVTIDWTNSEDAYAITLTP
jgi:hypothetical protein